MSETAVLAKVTARLTGTIGANIDKVWELREKKRQIEAESKKIAEAIAELEEGLLERLDKEDTTKSQGKKASVWVSTAVVASVEDWDAFHEFIRKNKYFHLLHKRVADPAYRELLERGKVVPGVKPFTKRTLNIRSLTT